ncbi:MAG: YtxH domain-containing protein [Patescibacteria group bacterium]
MQKKSGSFTKGLIFGGLVGAIAALFTAPKKGKEMQHDLEAKLDELIAKGHRLQSDAGTAVKKAKKSAKRAGSKTARVASRAVKEIKKEAMVAEQEIMSAVSGKKKPAKNKAKKTVKKTAPRKAVVKKAPVKKAAPKKKAKKATKKK